MTVDAVIGALLSDPLLVESFPRPSESCPISSPRPELSDSPHNLDQSDALAGSRRRPPQESATIWQCRTNPNPRAGRQLPGRGIPGRLCRQAARTPCRAYPAIPDQFVTV